MLTTALAAMRAHWRRLLRTCSAVVLGVAFLAGTLVLGDTMRSGFADAFSGVFADTDVVVQGADMLGTENGEQRRMVPEDVLTRVADLDGTDRVVGRIEGVAQVIGADGQPVGGEGPPTIGENWVDDPELNPMQIAQGRPPAAPGEIVIDHRTAQSAGLGLGDTTTVRTPTVASGTVVGIATFGAEDSVAGSGYTAFTDDQARALLLGGAAGYTSLGAVAEDGTAPADLRDEVAYLLPDGFEALTGTEAAAAAEQAIGEDFLDFFSAALLAFTGLALLVAAFSIYNTFAVVLAQRTRESALLRAVGATRRQVLGGIVLEALAVGVLASVLGAAVGLGLAELLRALVASFGIDLSGRLTIEVPSLVVASAVGLLVTLAAGILPAIRASRVAPLAALRDSSVEQGGASQARSAVGALVTAAGVVGVVWVAVATPSGSLLVVGLAAVACLVGVVALGPAAARPFARVMATPLATLRGATGRLAGGNAMRNPTRTAGTAAALMIGVAVVVLFTTVASSMSSAVRQAVTGTIAADLLVVDDDFSGSGMDPAMAGSIAALDGVEAAAGLGWGGAMVDGEEAEVTVTDPVAFATGLGDRVVDGSVAELGDDQLAVSTLEADDRDWQVGSPVEVAFVDGATVPMEVGAIYDEAQMLAGPLVMPRSVWTRHNVRTLDSVIAVTLEPGADEAAVASAVTEVTQATGAPAAQTLQEYADDVAGEVNQLLGIVYVLLALSIVIAVMGISNTLALSIHERTRELGVLRAVGQTRSQTRAMVRWESVLIAVFGTVGGAAVGLLSAWGFVRGLGSIDPELSVFSLPVGQLVAIVVIGAVAGVLASVRPARRAARLDVLGAIAAA